MLALRRRFGDRAPSVYLVIVVLAGALAATLLLLLLALLLGGQAPPVDRAIMEWVAERRGAVTVRASLHVTALGNTLTLATIAFWILAALWPAVRRHDLAVFVAAVVGGRLLNEGLKALFGRDRPETLEWATHVASPAFPSGHAMSSTIVFGAAAYLLMRDGAGAGVGLKIILWATVSLLVLAVAASRVVLGVHYPSDVVAGILAGALWAGAVLSAIPAAGHGHARPDAARPGPDPGLPTG